MNDDTFVGEIDLNQPQPTDEERVREFRDTTEYTDDACAIVQALANSCASNGAQVRWWDEPRCRIELVVGEKRFLLQVSELGVGELPPSTTEEELSPCLGGAPPPPEFRE